MSPARKPSPLSRDDILFSLYQLTLAKVEVANGLLIGYSLDEISSLRHVSLKVFLMAFSGDHG